MFINNVLSRKRRLKLVADLSLQTCTKFAPELNISCQSIIRRTENVHSHAWNSQFSCQTVPDSRSLHSLDDETPFAVFCSRSRNRLFTSPDCAQRR